MISTGQKITVAGVLAALISAVGFVWTQWRQVRSAVEDNPVVIVMVAAAVVLIVAFAILRAIVNRRQMSGRVRRGR